MLWFFFSSTQNKIVQTEKKLQVIKSRTDGQREEQVSLSEDNLKLKEQVKIGSEAHKEQEVLNGKLHLYKAEVYDSECYRGRLVYIG